MRNKLKLIIVVLAIMFTTNFSSSAKNKVCSYKKLVNCELTIMYNDTSQDLTQNIDFTVWIHNNKRDKTLSLKSKDLKSFCDSLNIYKHKLLKFKKIIKTVDIDNGYYKILGVQGYYKCFFSKDGHFRTDLENRFYWGFYVTELSDNKKEYILLESDKMVYSLDKNITTSGYILMFGESKDFDDLIKALDRTTIEKFIKNKIKIEDMIK